MALVTSGEISIGGTATNRSINVELGLAQDANSNLDQSDFRSLAGISGSGTEISLEDFYGKSATDCREVTLWYNSKNCSGACAGTETGETFYTKDCDFSCECYELYSNDDCTTSASLSQGYYSNKTVCITVDKTGKITKCESCVKK